MAPGTIGQFQMGVAEGDNDPVVLFPEESICVLMIPDGGASPWEA
jgi:hypothetical protein